MKNKEYYAENDRGTGGLGNALKSPLKQLEFASTKAMFIMHDIFLFSKRKFLLDKVSFGC